MLFLFTCRSMRTAIAWGRRGDGNWAYLLRDIQREKVDSAASVWGMTGASQGPVLRKASAWSNALPSPPANPS